MCPSLTTTLDSLRKEALAWAASTMYHAAGPIGDAIVWVGGNIMEELVNDRSGVLSSRCLLGADGDEELVAWYMHIIGGC